MDNRNPYAAPRTNVAAADDPESYGDVRVFSAKGRLGRLRFIGYSAGVSILILIAFGIAAGITAFVSPDLAVVLAIGGYVTIIVVQVLLTIQRSHDMNVTGWLSLVSFVPLGVLVFWLVPGTKGENRYGLPPPPNTAGVVVLACVMPFIAIIGILAAIAIPAYQDYTIRAQVSEGLNLAVATKAAVAEAFERTGAAPASRFDAGLSNAATDTSGRYVESIDVEEGTILVIYGGNANATIAGRMLALQPYVQSDESVVWRCAWAPEPSGAVPMAGANAVDSIDATDIEPIHLPSACRP